MDKWEIYFFLSTNLSNKTKLRQFQVTCFKSSSVIHRLVILFYSALRLTSQIRAVIP